MIAAFLWVCATVGVPLAVVMCWLDARVADALGIEADDPARWSA